jgi:hypothetical protein
MTVLTWGARSSQPAAEAAAISEQAPVKARLSFFIFCISYLLTLHPDPEPETGSIAGVR